MIDESVLIPVDDKTVVPGRCTVPDQAIGLVVFVHGSGSSRNSPRNRFVAEYLNGQGLGTILFDLLTADEAADRVNVFDIELLANRVSRVRTWIASQPQLSALPVGLFGASTGAAAALVSAATKPLSVAAVVSRGGRPDLAREWLAQVAAPTLFIVGGEDHPVVEWNKQAAQRLVCPREIAIVAGATHLFEEPGALARAADLAAQWFTRHLG